jgi:transposase-like protein
MDTVDQGERMNGQSGRGFIGPADVLADFSADFLNAARCREWLIGKLHHGCPVCPHCGTPVYENFMARYLAGGRIRCKGCSKQFTAWTGTWMSGSKMDPREVLLLALLIAMDQGTGLIAAKLGGEGRMAPGGRSKATVCDWRKRFAVHTRVKEIAGV